MARPLPERGRAPPERATVAAGVPGDGASGPGRSGLWSGVRAARGASPGGVPGAVGGGALDQLALPAPSRGGGETSAATGCRCGPAFLAGLTGVPGSEGHSRATLSGPPGAPWPPDAVVARPTVARATPKESPAPVAAVCPRFRWQRRRWGPLPPAPWRTGFPGCGIPWRPSVPIVGAARGACGRSRLPSGAPTCRRPRRPAPLRGAGATGVAEPSATAVPQSGPRRRNDGHSDEVPGWGVRSWDPVAGPGAQVLLGRPPKGCERCAAFGVRTCERTPALDAPLGDAHVAS